MTDKLVSAKRELCLDLCRLSLFYLARIEAQGGIERPWASQGRNSSWRRMRAKRTPLTFRAVVTRATRGRLPRASRRAF